MADRRNHIHGFAAALVFFGSLTAFLVLGPDAPQGGDTVPNRYLAAGVTCGDLTLNRYGPLWGVPSGEVVRFPYYATRSVTGDLVSTFGPVVPVLSSPAYFLAGLAGITMDSAAILAVGRVLAGLLSALASLFTFLAARRVSGTGAALIATMAFVLGSGVLTVASRGLWQHTWALPLLAAGTWMLLKGLSGTRTWPLVATGAALSLAFACRPQAGLFGLAAALSILWLKREAFLPFALAAFPVLALVAAHNTFFFDSPFLFAQTLRSGDVALFKTGSDSLLGESPLEAVTGLLFSPSRGLFVLSPALAVGLVAGLVVGFRRVHHGGGSRGTGFPVGVQFMAALGLLVTAALWFDWWGGYTVTYRPLLEMLPILTVLVAWCLGRWRSRVFRVAWAMALAWSIVVSLGTVTHPGVVLWNEEVDVDRHPERVWRIRGSLVERVLQGRESDRLPLADSHPVSLEGCEVSLEARKRP